VPVVNDNRCKERVVNTTVDVFHARRMNLDVLLVDVSKR
jgi:hypothetical protein